RLRRVCAPAPAVRRPIVPTDDPGRRSPSLHRRAPVPSATPCRDSSDHPSPISLSGVRRWALGVRPVAPPWVGAEVLTPIACRLSPIAYRLSPIACRLSPVACRLSPVAWPQYGGAPAAAPAMVMGTAKPTPTKTSCLV